MFDEEIFKFTEFVDFMDIRFLRGGVKCHIIAKHGKKALIRYLESGQVGNKREGFKTVRPGYQDVTLIRHCWRRKK